MGSFKNTVVKPTFGKELGDRLSENHVYVSASRWDPGPNHIVESLACDLATYVHHQGGGAVEMAGRDHAYKTFEELAEILESKAYTKNSAMEVKNWDDVAVEYFDIIKEACGS